MPKSTLSRWIRRAAPGGGLGLALGLFLATAVVGAGPRYLLVFHDGRQLEIEAYEEAGPTLYYYRYDARVGVARNQIREIRELAAEVEAPPLESVIVSQVLQRHGLRFSAQDFIDETRYDALIATRLDRPEQAAYIQRLVALAQQEALEREADFQAAEAAGDVAATQSQAQARDAALEELHICEQAREALWMRWGAAAPPLGWAGEASAAADPAAEALTPSDPWPVSAEGGPPPDALEQANRRLARLQLERDRLVLFIKKHYDTGHSGGYLEVKAARRQVALLELQIRHCAQTIAELEAPRRVP